MTPLRIRLGQAIRELREAAGFSQEAFAHHIRVHRTSMGSIERGKINVRMDTLEQVATGLEMRAWELLRVAEVGTGPAEALRASRGRRRRLPYGSEKPQAGTNVSARRRVAEERGRTKKPE